MPSIDERLRAHAAELDASAPKPVPTPVQPRRGRWQLAVAVGATAAVVGLLFAGAAVVRSSKATVVGEPLPSVPAPETIGTLPDPPDPLLGPEGRYSKPPPELPQGWVEVESGGIKMFAPPPWKVTERACPGEANSIAVGAPPPSECGGVPTDLPWIWIAPAKTFADQSHGCYTGFHNGLPGCLVQKITPNGDHELSTLFVDGTSIAIVWTAGPSNTESGLGEITRTWQYADPTRPEAQSPTQPGGDSGYMQNQPLAAASSFALAFAQGRCADVQDLSRMTAVSCNPAAGDPAAAVVEARLEGLGGAVEVQAARVVVEPGPRTLELWMQTEWSLEEQAPIWKVIEATER